MNDLLCYGMGAASGIILMVLAVWRAKDPEKVYCSQCARDIGEGWFYFRKGGQVLGSKEAKGTLKSAEGGSIPRIEKKTGTPWLWLGNR